MGFRDNRQVQGRNGGHMSEANGKVCCNCRHNIRTGEITNIECHCDLDNHYIGYIACMEHWCRHWSRDKVETEAEDGNVD